MTGLIDDVLAAVAGLDPAAVYALTALFMVLETSVFIGLVVPGDLAVLVAGTTATDPARFACVAAAATCGSLAGESFGYVIGRRFGGRIRACRLGRWLGEHRWDRAEAFLNGRGGPSVAASRFVGVAHALVPVLAGTVRMPYRRYIAWTSVGSLTWSVAYVGVGVAAGASYREYSHQLSLAAYAVLAVAVVVVATLSIIRRRRRGRSSGSASQTGPTAAGAPRALRTWNASALLFTQAGWTGFAPGYPELPYRRQRHYRGSAGPSTQPPATIDRRTLSTVPRVR